MTAGERGAAKARAAQIAFNPADIAERTWLATVLADFQRVCLAADDQTTFAESARISAYNEGMRQAYLYLRRILALTPEEIRVESDRLDREEDDAIENRIENEVRRRLHHAA